MKKRLPSIVMYALNLILLMVPWLTVGDKKYNIYQFSIKLMQSGVENTIHEAGVYYENITQLKLGVMMELGLFAIFIMISIIYLVKMIIGKTTKINIANMAIGVAIVVLHVSAISLGAFVVELIDMAIPFTLLFITLLEIPVKDIVERWDEAMVEANRQKMEAEAERKEAEERLRFDGKYTKMFYYYVWKNFKRNWKDYALLLVSNTVIFGCMIVGFGMKEILAVENTTRGTQIFNGLNRILVYAMIPMAIIAVFIFILLFFHYVKCRARNFGVFLTLGMRRNMLYRFVAIEYMSILGIAMVVGGRAGTGILAIFIENSETYVGIALPMSIIGIGTYVKSVAVLLLICIVSLMSARDIFIDFNVGKSTDLRAIGEKMPMKFRNGFIAAGIILYAISVFRYQNLDNFENVTLLLVFFIGMFLVIRYGMADYLIRERKKRKYLGKLLIHNQLFHKSKTNAGYIGAIFVIHFCVLFYFMFQMISANISEDIERLFPYDVVCLADKNDNDILGEIRENYDVEMMEYPALRVSTYDATEKLEDTRSGGTPIQGQHIGISESTYHALKKKLDPLYEEVDLNLDAEGDFVHIVYQQDKSEHAKPVAFNSPRSKPLMHIGQPCRGTMVHMLHKENIGYKYYQVRSEEIGSLIGVFRQGERESLIVFSDEYFEKAKDFWKTIDIYDGVEIEDEAGRIPGVTIHQGITRLVLLNIDEKDLPMINEQMEIFEKRHVEEETKLFERYFSGKGVYDLSVSYHYMKEEAVKNLQTERLMKITMNGLVIIVFFFMNLMLVIIKLLSEMELNLRRTEFFNCMGMRKKDRIRLIRKEFFRYYYMIPLGIAMIFAAIYTACVLHARMYTTVDIKVFLGNMIPLWIGYFILSTVMMWIIANVYAYRMEGNNNGRNS